MLASGTAKGAHAAGQVFLVLPSTEVTLAHDKAAQHHGDIATDSAERGGFVGEVPIGPQVPPQEEHHKRRSQYTPSHRVRTVIAGVIPHQEEVVASVGARHLQGLVPQQWSKHGT